MANDTTGRSRNEVRGIRAVAEALSLETFPMDIEDINYSVGDIEVVQVGGDTVPVRDLTDRFQKKEYATTEEIMGEIHQLLRAKAA